MGLFDFNEVFSSVMNTLTGAVSSAGGAIVKAGQQAWEPIGDNMQTIIPVGVAAVLAAAAGAGVGVIGEGGGATAGAAVTENSVAAAFEAKMAAGLTMEQAAEAVAVDMGMESGMGAAALQAAPQVASGALTAEQAAAAVSADMAGVSSVTSIGGGTTAGGSTMTGVMPYLLGSQVASAIIGADAARKAANTSADAAQSATDAQLKMYLQSREDLAPWRKAGEAALVPLQAQALNGPGDFNPEEQPGYQFGYKEFVEKPLLQNASATGKLRSGNVLRALSDRAQDYASTQYDSWLNRWLTKMQPLQSLAGLGQTSASTTANVGQNAAQGMAQTTMAGGNAVAGGAINQANALTGGINAGSNLLMQNAVLDAIKNGSLLTNRNNANG